MMGNASEMGNQATLLDVMARLENCLHDLDEIGASIAAAHLSACLDVLAESAQADSSSSEVD